MPATSLTEHISSFFHKGREIAYVQQQGYRRVAWTYRETFETACRFSQELAARGIAKGDRVILWGANSAQWAAVFFGCALAGVAVVPMDRIGAAEFVLRVFDDVKARLIVADRDLLPSGFDRPTLALEDLSSTVSSRPATAPEVELSRNDVLQIVFTSGTTAEPRGVVITHGNVLANLEPFHREIAKYRKYERFFHPIRFLNLVPLSHVFGQFMTLFIPPLIEGTVVFQESLSPGEVVQTIHKERISVLVAVPRMVQSLKSKLERDFEAEGEGDWLGQQLKRSKGEHFAKRWWRFRKIHNRFGWKFWAIISGGATLDRETEEFWERLSFVVVQGYGLTESTSLISVNHPFHRGRGSIGKVLPGRDIKLSDSGEILVRGENIASSYFQRGTMQPVAGEEGWFHTGDLGELDSEGYLHFRGRQKAVIVTAEGMKVYPDDLERVLKNESGVRDAVVFGLNRNGNAETCAALLLESGISGAEVVKAANSKLAGYQAIREWVSWPEADFPRTSTQKPRLGAIQEYAAQQLGGAGVITAPAGSVAEMIAKVKGRAAQPISAEAELESDLNLNSLERVELMSALEDRYQVELKESDLGDVTTVGQLEKMLQRSQREKPREAVEYSYPRWAQRWPITWIRLFIYYLLAWPATMILGRQHTLGRERLRDLNGPALVVCNHVTYVDVGFVLAALPARLRHRLAVAMEGERVHELHHPSGNFLLKIVYKSAYYLMTALFNVFPLPKLTGFRQSFAYAGESADRGYSVLVFPEGHRTRDGNIAPFRSGTGLLADRLHLPVIPMRIDGLWQRKQEKRWLFSKTPITVRIGSPVTFSPGTTPEHAAAELERRVREL
jgi:long-chain acyl-CoA synthetase